MMWEDAPPPPVVEFSWANFIVDIVFWYLVSCGLSLWVMGSSESRRTRVAEARLTRKDSSEHEIKVVGLQHHNNDDHRAYSDQWVRSGRKLSRG